MSETKRSSTANFSSYHIEKLLTKQAQQANVKIESIA
jgi:hypothetical protein